MTVEDLIKIIEDNKDKPIYFKVKYLNKEVVFQNISYGSYRGSYDLFSVYLDDSDSDLKNLKNDIDNERVFYGWKGGEYTYDYCDEVCLSMDAGHPYLEESFKIKEEYEEVYGIIYINCSVNQMVRISHLDVDVLPFMNL